MVIAADKKATHRCGCHLQAWDSWFCVGCVIRDDTGTVLVVVSLPLAESINVLHAELMALRFGLQLSIPMV